MADAPLLQPPLIPTPVPPPAPTRSEKVHEFVELLHAFVESLYSLLLGFGCITVLVLLLYTYFSSDEPTQVLLGKLARSIHDNWRATLVLLFPTIRSTWRRIEPRVQKLGWVKLNEAPPQTGGVEAPLPRK